MQTLSLVVRKPLPTSLLRPFQKGVGVEVEVGGYLLDLLTGDLCLTEAGIAKIQTIFWQGKPVDDIAGCVVRAGGVLALSAALPGLVGACLRRGGAWSALRDSISHQGEAAVREGARGVITVKLFNFMLAEVGPLLLERGVMLDAADAAVIVAEPETAAHLVRASVAGQTAAAGELAESLDRDETVLLRVETVGTGGPAA